MFFTKDFSKRIRVEQKYPLLVSYFVQSQDENVKDYILSNLSLVFKLLIQQENAKLLSAFLNSGISITKNVKQKLLRESLQSQNLEIRAIVMEYENSHAENQEYKL